ncbi:MAG: ABC transporter permease [Saprospiraceae bacterium]|nr:MAG: ABC transporter permease [Saprospiraceae bacterium]
MFKNFLTVAWRNLRKYKLYSALNILGLSVGITGSFLIFLFLQSELSYDKHFQHAKDIYRLGVEYDFSGKIDQFSNIARPVAPQMKEDYPQVETYTRMAGLNGLFTHKAQFDYQHNPVKSDRVFYADSSFFEVFDYEFLAGNPEKALVAPNTIVLTQQMAKNIFGNADPIGQQLKVDGTELMTVTGLLADSRDKTHMPFDALVSWTTQFTEQENDIWLGRHVYSYLRLQEGADPGFLEAQFDSFFDKYMAANFKQAGGTAKLIVQPLESIHLNSNLNWEAYANGNTATIKIFSVIALFLLLIASFNYMNLAIAQSGGRAREVGMRKVMGARKSTLISQYLVESVLVALIALWLVIGLSFLFLPQFDMLAGQELSINFFRNPGLLIGLVATTGLVGLISGIYPAFVLSGFKPVDIFKGVGGATNNRNHLRKILVVTQFVIAIALMASTLFVNQQVAYLQEKDLGFDRENIMAIEMKDTLIFNNLNAIQQELEQMPAILGSAVSSALPGMELNQLVVNIKDGQGERVPFGVQFMEVDYDFADLIGMEIVKGRNFDRAFPADLTTNVIINEAAARKFGWEADPINKIMDFGPESDGTIPEYKTIGVIRDFHAGSLHNAIQPIVLFLPFQPGGRLFLKLSGNDLPETIAQIEKKWAGFGASAPLEYVFLDQSLADQYIAESKLLKLLGYFALLTIFISALGLFGLVSLASTQRKKEIGIRKVLGASINGLLLLLSREFILLVAIANLLAWPLAYYGIRKWLEGFAYSIDITWTPFLLAAFLSLLMAILTLGYHALRAAFVNPVEALRHE